MSLYQITNEIQHLIDAMLEHGADSTEAAIALDEAMADLDAALDVKADQYAKVIRELEARADARAEEAARIRALANTDAATAQRLKERLRDAMQRTGRTKISTPTFQLSVAANGGKQPMTIDPGAVEDLPANLTRIVREPDKEAIRAALESGEAIPGCTLLPRGHSLRIR